MAGEEIAELQQSEKFVEEMSAAKVGQTPMITGDSEVSWRSAYPEPYLTKNFATRIPELVARGWRLAAGIAVPI